MDGTAKHQLKNERRLQWIAEEWQRYSDPLAEWAMERLVNRRDVWSQYTLKNGEVGVVMLPIKERRKAGTDMVTLNKLRRHFAGKAVSHLIGLHSISDHSTAKWFAIDIDMHDETVVNADEIARANWDAAFQWSNRLRAAGLDPILMDSNGVGGYHIWVLLDKEYPLAQVYDYADSVRADWEDLGLPRKPEIFPPRREVDEDDLPYGLRLPGRHHKRPYYTRIWNFDSVAENEWLEGGEAIEAMLNADPAPLPKLKSKPSTHTSSIRKGPKRVPRKRKPRVCLDLDGVLARYEGWKGSNHIGTPLPGALEFAKSLSDFAEIVIFTSRCSQDAGSETNRIVDPAKMRIAIIDWLEHYQFPFDDVYVGQGKPRASAFIDDRAVQCSPQIDKEAFQNALVNTRSLLNGTKRKKLRRKVEFDH
ncbi:MAG: hypothetical protein ACJ72Z_04215 [Pyrinomonadaceae bacterium]